MSNAATTRKPSVKRKPVVDRDLARVMAMPDDEIDYSDIPAMDPGALANAIVAKPADLMAVLGSGVKRQITLRIDEDVVELFKRQGKGYQRLMNFALRAYMLRHESAAKDSGRKKPKPARGQ